VEAERRKKQAESLSKTLSDKKESLPELIPTNSKNEKPVIETRSKIAETFNTNPRYPFSGVT